MRVAYTITPGAITVVVKNQVRTVPKNNPNFKALADHLRQKTHDVEKIKEMLDLKRFIAKAMHGRVQISDTEVRLAGKPINNVVADRILDLMREGHDVEIMSMFLDRLMNNPLETAQNELLLWLEAGAMPLTEDGCFLAFKAVRGDYKDKHTGTLDNSVGKVVSMPRERVDANRHNECSQGLHFCSPGYLSSFAVKGDPIMILKIDPADVVAIPIDYKNQKGRAWRYEVVGQVPPDEVAETFFGVKPMVDTYQSQVIGNEQQSNITMAPAPEYTDTADINYTVDTAMVPGAEFASVVVTQDILAGFNNAQVDTAAALNNASVKKPAKTKAVAAPEPARFKTSDGRTFTESQVRKAVATAGSVRGGARLLNVSKSTFQGWNSQL